MSGKRYFLDTNAIIQLLKGNQGLITLLKPADFIAISIISRLEFLSFYDLSDKDKALYQNFENRVTVIELALNDMDLLARIVKTRATSSLKLPDAIILSSAHIHNSILLTADKKMLTQSQFRSVSFKLV